MTDHPLLTLPDTPESALSIRAKALLFHDPSSLALLEHIERLARSEAMALTIGETGTGKEMVARHIHRLSVAPVPEPCLLPNAEALLAPAPFGNGVARLVGLFDGMLLQSPPRLFAAGVATLVRRAYLHCRENQAQPARLLGLSRNSLRTLLQRHGLISDGALADGDDDAAELTVPGALDDVPPLRRPMPVPQVAEH